MTHNQDEFIPEGIGMRHVNGVGDHPLPHTKSTDTTFALEVLLRLPGWKEVARCQGSDRYYA